jgi:hypothetical protein
MANFGELRWYHCVVSALNAPCNAAGGVSRTRLDASIRQAEMMTIPIALRLLFFIRITI